MDTNFNLTQNNYGVSVIINILDKDSKPVNITGCSIYIDIIYPNKTKYRYSMPILDAEKGRVQLTITSEMTTQLGIHTCYIDVVSAVAQITLNEKLRYSVQSADRGIA